MDKSKAIDCFTALAQPTRLAAFRRLVKAYPDQIAAGAIARACKVPHNTMSTHLSVLNRAGLVAVRRDGRMMHYSADLEGFRSLMGFMMRDCCGGRADICAPLVAELACCAPTPTPSKRETVRG
jgi:DNA-binding transcriptional ArsR family regulator